MQPKTEEFLNLLLWSADLLARPTFRNLTDSYESWAYRNGLLRQAATLERQQLLERDTGSPDDRLYRLTAQGRASSRRSDSTLIFPPPRICRSSVSGSGVIHTLFCT